MDLTKAALRARVEDAIDLVNRADQDWRADHRNRDLYDVLRTSRAYFRALLTLSVSRGEMSEEAMRSIWHACS